MALTPDEQKLLDFANAALPSWFTSHARVQEFLGGAAKVMGAAQRQLEDWFTHVLIGNATGAGVAPPIPVDWTNRVGVIVSGTDLTKEEPLWNEFPEPDEEVYLPGEPPSGNVVGKIAATVLAPVNTPSYQQDFDVPAADSAQFDVDTLDSFDAGAAGVHDFDGVAFAILLVASSDTPGAGFRTVYGKLETGAPNHGYELMQLGPSDDRLQFYVDGPLGSTSLQSPVAVPGDNTPFYVLSGISVSEVKAYLDSSLGNATPVSTAGVGSITSTALFALGSQRAIAFGGDIAAVLIWSGAEAEYVLANRDKLPAWWLWAKAALDWLTETDGWGNSGAVSSQTITGGDGYAEWSSPDIDKRWMCGLSNGDTDQGYADIDRAIEVDGTDINIYESGAKKNITSLGPYKSNSLLRIQLDAGVITYWHGSTKIWTSSGGSAYPLLIDTALYSNGATISDAVISDRAYVPSYSPDTQYDPDWLNQHARDRGTSRQEAETDVALRSRLRTIDDAVTRPALLSAAQAIIDAEGISGTVAMAELRRDKAFIGSFVSDTGTGGTFTGTAPDMKFEPDAPGWARPPFVQDFPPFGYQLAISGAATGGNDGTFPVTGLDLDKAEYTNGSGVAEVDATVTWTAQKLDQDGNLADGFARAFIDRGYRIGHGKPNTIITILPYGSTPGTVTSVEEMLRQKKAAGIRSYVERRLTDPDEVRPLWWGFPVPNEEVYLPGLPAIGNVVGSLNGMILTPNGVLSYQQDFDVPAADSVQLDVGQYQRLEAATGSDHDFDGVAFAILVVASSDAGVATGASIMGKRNPTPYEGYELRQQADDTLRVEYRNADSSVFIDTTATILNDSTPFYVLIGVSVAEVKGYLDTSIENVSPAAVSGTLTNTGTFRVGNVLPAAWGGDIAAVLIWSGADAETVLANRAHLPDWWTWAKATAAWYT